MVLVNMAEFSITIEDHETSVTQSHMLVQQHCCVSLIEISRILLHREPFEIAHVSLL